MGEQQKPPDESSDPEWLEEFQTLANEQLGHGPACDQVHPIIEEWLDELFESDPPQSRDAVWQAMACLTSEVLVRTTPDNVFDALTEHCDENEVADWVEALLMVGRAFQIALDNGRLDDL